MTMSDRIAVMNKGRYEQLADPETLYERPRTRFVAGYLGVSNLLSGTSDGGADDYALVRLEDGTVISVLRRYVPGPGAVQVGVRPEKIRLSDPARARRSSTTRLPARCETPVPGVSTHQQVEPRTGAHHRVRARSAPGPSWRRARGR
jgi:spermidine/putrescine transport system ATP-binding protein